MNILVIHEVSYRKKVVYEYQDFAERLAALGHKVNIIDYDDTGDYQYKKFSISKTGIADVTLENTPYINLPIIKYISGRYYFKKLLKETLNSEKIDIVFLYSVFINGTNTVRICKKLKIPVIYRVLDVYHKLRQSILIKLPLLFGEKYIYKNADLVCVTNEKMEEYVKNLIKPKSNEIYNLHHGVDTSLFKKIDRDNELAEKYNITPDDKVIMFLGTIYDFSGIDTIINNFQKLEKNVPNCKMLIVGGGIELEKLRNLASQCNIEDKIIFTDFQPYNIVPRFLSLADMCFNSFHINDITRDIFPIKLLQYLSCGQPVVSTPLPDVVRLLPETEAGIVYSNIVNADEFITKIAGILLDENLRNKLSENALKYMNDNYNLQNQIKKLEILLEDTIMKKSGN